MSVARTGKTVISLIAGLFLLYTGLSAGEIAVTAVKISAGKTAEITFNGAVVVKDMKIIKGKDGFSFKFPEYASTKGRKYPYVKLTSAQAESAITKALEAGTPSSEKYARLTYKIESVMLMKNASGLKAVARVSLNDSLEIECKVFEGDAGAWVSWPGNKETRNKWRQVVKITDPALKNEIEAAIVSKYINIAEEAGR